MWRATVAIALLLLGTVSGSYFSEGGNGRIADQSPPQEWDEYASEYYKNRQPQAAPQVQSEYGNLDEAKLAELLREVNQMNEEEKLAVDGADEFVPVSADESYLYDDKQPLYRDNQYFDQAFPQQPEQQIDIELEKTKSIGGPGNEVKSHPLVEPDVKEVNQEVKETKKPIVAQKKGQNEFVEFVDPGRDIAMKSSKSVESIEKRVVATVNDDSTAPRGIAGFSQSGNVMFLVAATVFVVATVTGGGIFYKIQQNSQAPPSEFSHYAPAGPGKDKRGGKRAGDDTLAYKAQLHHYQQTKQKIICGGEEGTLPQAGLESAYDDGAVTEEEEEENNFSVYECPGLAPTGDIEVQNPNFDTSSFRP